MPFNRARGIADVEGMPTPTDPVCADVTLRSAVRLWVIKNSGMTEAGDPYGKRSDVTQSTQNQSLAVKDAIASVPLFCFSKPQRGSDGQHLQG
jgi:hypothetical protein